MSQLSNIQLQDATPEEIGEELARRDGSYVHIRIQKPEIRTCDKCGQWLGLKKKNELLLGAIVAIDDWLKKIVDEREVPFHITGYQAYHAIGSVPIEDCKSADAEEFDGMGEYVFGDKEEDA